MRDARAEATRGDGPRSAVLLLHAGPRAAGLAELASALAGALPEGWCVRTASLHGDPDVEATVAHIVAAGAHELVVVPTTPQFREDGTGRALHALYAALRSTDAPLEVRVHPSWHDDAGYVSALARLVADCASAGQVAPEETLLRFVSNATGGPGDGSACGRAQAWRTAELVAERVGWPLHRVTVDRAADGAVGDARPHASAEGAAGSLACALACDGGGMPPGSWTLSCPPLHTFPPFIAALKRLVLKGLRRVPTGKRPPAPLLPSRERHAASLGRVDATRFIMVGASVRGALGRGAGPRLRHSDPHALTRVKTSHHDVGALLEWLREATPVREALLWSTCQRSELYAWLPAPAGADDDAALVAQLRRALFGNEPEGLEVVALEGVDAHHHLLRTACGLNSDLPGDRDVASQLLTALRRAHSAGTAAGLAETLVADAVAVARDVCAHTPFGRFATGYCAAALFRVCEVDGLRPGTLRHVTIGGSTTSRSVLAALRGDHDVPPPQLTAVYRDHHGQMKQLRAALGGGRRLRVHAYTDDRVLSAIEDADVVYFGIDQPEPVMEIAALAELRDLEAHPLTLVDFNSAGSLATGQLPRGVRVWSARELDDAVAAHAAITATRAGFTTAVSAAEALIARHLPRRPSTDDAVTAAGRRPC